jgi:hypothetical protein
MPDQTDQSAVRVFGPADQPFLTQDSILAFALYLAFTAFYDDGLPCVNYYTLDHLRQLGFKGLKPQEAAQRAISAGIRGVVEYMFRQPESELLKAFHEEKKLIENSVGEANVRIRDLLNIYKNGGRDYNETIIRLAAVIIYMRAEFLTIWKQTESLVKLDTPLKKTERRMPDGSKVVTTSGFRYIGVNAGEETKKKVGLC